LSGEVLLLGTSIGTREKGNSLGKREEGKKKLKNGGPGQAAQCGTPEQKTRKRRSLFHAQSSTKRGNQEEKNSQSGKSSRSEIRGKKTRHGRPRINEVNKGKEMRTGRAQKNTQSRRGGNGINQRVLRGEKGGPSGI